MSTSLRECEYPGCHALVQPDKRFCNDHSCPIIQCKNPKAAEERRCMTHNRQARQPRTKPKRVVVVNGAVFHRKRCTTFHLVEGRCGCRCHDDATGRLSCDKKGHKAYKS